jgi:hypothetical protein
MTRMRKTTKLIREGKYAAEVPIDLLYGEELWSPTMSPDDSRKLENARLALQRGDIAEASKYGQVSRQRLSRPVSQDLLATMPSI